MYSEKEILYFQKPKEVHAYLLATRDPNFPVDGDYYGDPLSLIAFSRLRNINIPSDIIALIEFGAISTAKIAETIIIEIISRSDIDQ